MVIGSGRKAFGGEGAAFDQPQRAGEGPLLVHRDVLGQQQGGRLAERAHAFAAIEILGMQQAFAGELVAVVPVGLTALAQEVFVAAQIGHQQALFGDFFQDLRPGLVVPPAAWVGGYGRGIFGRAAAQQGKQRKKEGQLGQ